MKNIIIVTAILLSFNSAMADDRDALSEKSIAELIEAHRAWESKIEERIKRDNSSQTVTNASAIYTAAAIHSRKSIPTLLALICAKPLNQSIPKRAIPVSAIDYSKGILPDESQVHWAPAWYYIVPPSPASAALTQTPIDIETLVSELSSSEIASERMQLLAWVAMAKFGDSFLDRVREKQSDDDALTDVLKWNWILDYSSTNLIGSVPFDFRQFSNKVWSDAVVFHKKLTTELRRRVQLGQTTGDNDLVAEATNALIEIGEQIESSGNNEMAKSVYGVIPETPDDNQIALDEIIDADLTGEEETRR